MNLAGYVHRVCPGRLVSLQLRRGDPNPRGGLAYDDVRRRHWAKETKPTVERKYQPILSHSNQWPQVPISNATASPVEAQAEVDFVKNTDGEGQC